MQVSTNSPSSAHVFMHPSSFKLWEEDFALKLKVSEEEEEEENGVEEDETKGFVTEEKQSSNVEEDEEEEEEAEESDDDEFRFIVSTNPYGSPISADHVFQDGQIRPVYPLFDRDLLLAATANGAEQTVRPRLKKLFFEEVEKETASSSSTEPEGPYCEWRKGGRGGEGGKEVIESTPGSDHNVCKKSNSTGFSKLWRFKDFVHIRSNSDGKDAFVFLNNNSNNNNKNTSKAVKNGVEGKAEEGEKVELKVVKKERRTKSGKTASLAAHYERNYGAAKGGGGDKRRSSYLPYRVGFFTSVNGLTKNVHPF